MLSIVMIAWNEGPWIESSIRSICEATDGEYEFILIDDASTTGPDLADIGKRLPEAAGFSVMRMKTRAGVSACRNFGRHIALGDVIQFHDGHD